MKKINYDELNLKDDTQVFHMWEPLKFEIKENYQFINQHFLFNLLSNTIFHIIAPSILLQYHS